MKIFITGATGYIGHKLAMKLVGKKYEIVALVRSRERAADLAQAGVQLCIGDLQDVPSIEQGMQGADAVFHLAAYAKLWPENEALYRSINVKGTETILATALKMKVKKVIVTSTASVYGPSASVASPINENTQRTAPFSNLYERTKADAELLTRTYAEKGLQVVLVSPTRVYGPGIETESNGVSRLLRLYLQGKWRFIPGDGRRVGNYCYIDDVVDGHIKAMQQGISGTSYLLGGEDASYNRFFDLIGQLSGKRYRLLHVPAPLLLLVSHGMKRWARLTGSKPLITPAWAKKYLENWSVSSQKAVRELGYTITPLDKGLMRTIKSIQQT